MAKVWVAERLVGIDIHLSLIHPSRLEVSSLPVPDYVLTLQTIRIRCPKYQSHPWEIIQKLHLGDVVRDAVPLEDRLISQGLVQVDLAVDPSGVSRVRHICETVEFQRWSEDDPIIQMQPDGDPRVKIFNGYNHILRRYTEARALRQVDGPLMLWYENEIGELESHIGRLGYV
jgi:hypothetical protein